MGIGKEDADREALGQPLVFGQLFTLDRPPGFSAASRVDIGVYLGGTRDGGVRHSARVNNPPPDASGHTATLMGRGVSGPAMGDELGWPRGSVSYRHDRDGLV